MVADARLGVKITSNIAYRRADTWVRPYGWAREHPPHPIPLPRRGGRVSNPPLREPRYAVSGRTRGVTLTPVSGTGQARPSPVKGEGVRAPFHARYSVV